MNRFVLILITAYLTIVAIGYGMTCKALSEEDTKRPVRGIIKSVGYHLFVIPLVYISFIYYSAHEDVSMLISKMKNKKKKTDG